MGHDGYTLSPQAMTQETVGGYGAAIGRGALRKTYSDWGFKNGLEEVVRDGEEADGTEEAGAL